MNGDEAIIELSTRQKKVAIPREYIKENDMEDGDEYGSGGGGREH